MSVPAKTRLSAAVFYALPEYETHDLIQLIDGVVVTGTLHDPQHQAVVGEILFLLMMHSKKHGGYALTAPVEVYLDEHNIFEPDVMYLSLETSCKIEGKRLVGAPDLVVEALSPRTAKFDRQEKYQAYEKHGVREYWIVDPVHELVEVWTLNAGEFARQGVYAAEDSFASETLAERVAVSSIF